MDTALIFRRRRCCPTARRAACRGWRSSSPPWRTDWPAGRRRSRSSRPCGRTRSGCGAARPRRPRTGIWRAIYPRSPPAWTICPRMRRVFLSESGRVDERMKNAALQLKQDTEALLTAGLLAGDHARLALTPEELYAALEAFPVIMADSLPTSRHPLRPRGLVTMNAKQLSSYGGSLETAVTDLEHYRHSGSAVLVLCGGETRARNLQRLLEERGVPAALDLAGAAMPAAGEVRLTVGALSAGSEWPSLKLAVLTEGQLSARPCGSASGSKRTPTGRSSSPTRTCPPATWWSTSTTAWPLRRHPADAGGRGGEGLHQDRLRRRRLPVRPRHPAGSGEQVHRRRRGHRAHPAQQAGGHGLDPGRRPGPKKAAKDLAKGLIALYAERQKRPGFAFSPDSPWQRGVRGVLPLCGDGGSAPVRLRDQGGHGAPPPHGPAAVRRRGATARRRWPSGGDEVHLDGKQAAILVPTTVLAQQHYATAVSRFRDFR